jgi:hypothetical protein
MLRADMLSVFMLAAIIKHIAPNVLRISVVIVSVVAPKHNVQHKMITMLKPSTTANVCSSHFLTKSIQLPVIFKTVIFKTVILSLHYILVRTAPRHSA